MFNYLNISNKIDYLKNELLQNIFIHKLAERLIVLLKIFTSGSMRTFNINAVFIGF
jgi:hypothetical protein